MGVHCNTCTLFLLTFVWPPQRVNGDAYAARSVYFRLLFHRHAISGHSHLQQSSYILVMTRPHGHVQVASTLEKMLAAPALLVPFGQASDACHLANERLQRINLIKG